jgi:hypothetical protein
VQAQRLAFPHGVRLLAGPYETLGEAREQYEQLRPLYPDANLSLVTKRGRTLPQVSPVHAAPPAFNLARVEQRRAAARHIAEHCARHGFDAVVEDWAGEPDVDAAVPALRANIWLGDTPSAPMPIISWVASSDRQLRPVLRGAWRDDYARRKATSQPIDWPALLEALITGLCAGLDGSAFE